MTIKDLEKLPLYQSAAIAEAANDENTKTYIINCLRKLYAGNYGELLQPDIDANNKDLKAGQGRILSRYKAAEKLTGDIYIISEFCAADPDSLELNHTTIIYCNEY